jgi:histidinol-phosphate aminotransferase
MREFQSVYQKEKSFLCVPGVGMQRIGGGLRPSRLGLAETGRAAEIYEKLTRRNIFVRYFAYPELKEKLRITIGTPEQNDTLLSALKEILQE